MRSSTNLTLGTPLLLDLRWAPARPRWNRLLRAGAPPTTLACSPPNHTPAALRSAHRRGGGRYSSAPPVHSAAAGLRTRRQPCLAVCGDRAVQLRERLAGVNRQAL